MGNGAEAVVTGFRDGPSVVMRRIPNRLVIVETHPIQYKAPLFRRLAADPGIDLTVLFAMIPDAAQQGAGFDTAFEWDAPLRDGYRSEVLENRAEHPSVTAFSGCDTPGMAARLRQLRPDAVLVNGWVAKTCLQALRACRRLGIPCMVRGEANLLRSRAVWKHLAHRILLRQYSAVLAIGSANRDFYRFHQYPEDRIFSAPYAVDNVWFAAQAADRSSCRGALRTAFGLAPDATVFLFAGKLENKKRPLDLLKALSLLPPESAARAQILVAGDGPLRSTCEGVARDQRLPVAFAGFLNQSRLPDAYAAADCLVLPSDAGETWGLVVNEAMASGLPAIVSDQVGCHPDLILPGKTGRVFPCGDLSSLAHRLAEMANDPARCRDMGCTAQSHVSAYSVDTATAGIVAALRFLKSERRPE